MADDTEIRQFKLELESKFNDFAQWAIDHWPDKNRPLSSTDFAHCRLALADIIQGANPPDNRNLDPAQGGEQYVNVAPAPWP
ncbi:hypothetical protein BH11PSE11_BH11PSE11_25990 [soil metagenome]